MSQHLLTPEEVVERYRREVTIGTLRNWRALRIGPDFIKVGKSVLYPIEKLEEWDRKNLVRCNSARPVHAGEAEEPMASSAEKRRL